MNQIYHLFHGMAEVAWEVFLAILPIVLIFLFLNAIALRLRAPIIKRIMGGFVVTYLGLVLFLQGVNIAFVPAGEFLGTALAELEYSWILIPLGFAIGFLVAFAEPAVQVMVKQVEEMTSGAIKARVMLLAISLGVALAVMTAMIRLLAGISLWWILVPGYILAFILGRFVEPNFLAMAFDNGGVATGPMCSTFILSLSVAVAGATPGRNPLLDGFGVVALIALAPILTTLFLGFFYKQKEAYRKRQCKKQSSGS